MRGRGACHNARPRSRTGCELNRLNKGEGDKLMKRIIPLSIMLIAAALIVVCQEKSLPEGLLAMAQTERAFARLSVEKGVREAFTTYFADDGVNFQPHPVNTKEAFAKQSATSGPP